MDEKNQLFDDDSKNSLFYRKLKYRTDISRQIAPIDNYVDAAKYALYNRVGNCGELVKCIMFLAGLFPLDRYFRDEEIFLSTLYLNSDHTLILLHQSVRYYEKADMEVGELSNFLEFASESKDLVNAILIDPWLYQAFRVQDLGIVGEIIDEYQVSNNFDGYSFLNYRGLRNELGCLDQENKTNYLEIVERCEEIFISQLDKLQRRRDSFAAPVRFREIQENLIKDISDQPHIDKIRLESLICFFNRLSQSSSSWFGNSSHSDRKGTTIVKVIKKLEEYKSLGYFPDIINLRELFFSVLRITTLVRGKNESQEVTAHSLKMTKTAKALFDHGVVTSRKYAFEDINGLSLDFIRNARDTDHTLRSKYIYLIRVLFGGNIDRFGFLYKDNFKRQCYLGVQHALDQIAREESNFNEYY
jgi:hypothetical protein